MVCSTVVYARGRESQDEHVEGARQRLILMTDCGVTQLLSRNPGWACSKLNTLKESTF